MRPRFTYPRPQNTYGDLPSADCLILCVRDLGRAVRRSATSDMVATLSNAAREARVMCAELAACDSGLDLLDLEAAAESCDYTARLEIDRENPNSCAYCLENDGLLLCDAACGLWRQRHEGEMIPAE